MHVTMVNKKLASGKPCDKCVQAEDLLRSRGLWERIDSVAWAIEGDSCSEGMQLSARFGVSTALRTADETLGTLVRAAHDVKDAAVGSRWKKGLVSWVATTTLLTTGLAAQQKMLDASAGVLHAIADNIAAAKDIVDAVEDNSPPSTGTSKG